MNTSFIKKLSSRLDFFIFGIILIGIFLRFYHIDRAVGGGDENQILLEWVYYPIEHIIGTYTPFFDCIKKREPVIKQTRRRWS